MNIYHFSGNGLALTSQIAVVAADEQQAMILAREAATEWCADPDTLELKSVKPFEPPCVVYVWNGDY